MSSDDTRKGIQKFVINTYINHSAVENTADLQRKLFSQNEKFIVNIPLDDILDCKSHYIKYLLRNF